MASSVSSYIPTAGAAATRAADAASMTGTNFSSWYRQDEGTFVATYAPHSPGTTGWERVWCVDDGTNSNTIALLKQNGSGAFYSTVQVGGVDQALLATAVIAARTVVRTATAYKANDFAQSHNGATVVTDTSGSVPIVTKFGFADPFGGVGCMHISSLRYYPKRLTNLELQSLSAQ